MVTLSQVASFGLAFPSLMMAGGGMMMFFATSSATIQRIVKDEFRGRVSGLYMMTWGLFPLGGLLAGTLADTLGAPSATLIGAGIVAVLFAGLVARSRGILWGPVGG